MTLMHGAGSLRCFLGCFSPSRTKSCEDGVWGLQLSPAEAGCFCKKQGAQCWSPLGAHRCPSFDTCSINQDCPRCPSSAALGRFPVLQICPFPSDPRCSAHVWCCRLQQLPLLPAGRRAQQPGWIRDGETSTHTAGVGGVAQ